MYIHNNKKKSKKKIIYKNKHYILTIFFFKTERMNKEGSLKECPSYDLQRTSNDTLSNFLSKTVKKVTCGINYFFFQYALSISNRVYLNLIPHITSLPHITKVVTRFMRLLLREAGWIPT